MSTINEKTHIPLGWAVTIMGLVVGLVFQAGVSYTRFAALESEFERHRAAEQGSVNKSFETELRVQKLEIMLGSIDSKLTAIDKKLDKLDKDGDRNGR
jgi:hypothetical protein